MGKKEEHKILLFTCLAKSIFNFFKHSYNVWRESQQWSFLVLGLLSEGVQIHHRRMRTETTSLSLSLSQQQLQLVFGMNSQDTGGLGASPREMDEVFLV